MGRKQSASQSQKALKQQLQQHQRKTLQVRHNGQTSEDVIREIERIKSEKDGEKSTRGINRDVDESKMADCGDVI